MGIAFSNSNRGGGGDRENGDGARNREEGGGGARKPCKCMLLAIRLSTSIAEIRTKKARAAELGIEIEGAQLESQAAKTNENQLKRLLALEKKMVAVGDREGREALVRRAIEIQDAQSEIQRAQDQEKELRFLLTAVEEKVSELEAKRNLLGKRVQAKSQSSTMIAIGKSEGNYASTAIKFGFKGTVYADDEAAQVLSDQKLKFSRLPEN